MVNSNKKIENIIIAAKDLFWKYGIKRVRVEEICKKARVSKMTFYKHFENKIELAKSVYDKVAEEDIMKFHEIIHENSSSEEKIKKFLLLKHKSTNQISQEFLIDFYTDKELGLKEFIEAKIQKAWQLILDDLKFAQSKGWIRKDIRPELIISISQKITELANDSKLLQLYDSPQELIMAFADFMIYGIMPPK
jgi:AcrR family transcriptional regulator